MIRHAGTSNKFLHMQKKVAVALYLLVVAGDVEMRDDIK